MGGEYHCIPTSSRRRNEPTPPAPRVATGPTSRHLCRRRWRSTSISYADYPAADRALGLLAGAGRTLPNPHLLSRTLLRREAVLSSRIEGTQASLSDLVLFEAGGARDDRGDVREVHNYVTAVTYVLDPERRLACFRPTTSVTAGTH
jgi:hypothetical protein